MVNLPCLDLSNRTCYIPHVRNACFQSLDFTVFTHQVLTCMFKTCCVNGPKDLPTQMSSVLRAGLFFTALHRTCWRLHMDTYFFERDVKQYTNNETFNQLRRTGFWFVNVNLQNIYAQVYSKNISTCILAVCYGQSYPIWNINHCPYQVRVSCNNRELLNRTEK